MAGHSKWKQIKNKKGAADQKRAQLFSKMLSAISIAAREEPSAAKNPRLRSLIERAQKAGVPKENIERATAASGEKSGLKEVVLEAYGPSGVSFVLETLTDNTNRTIAEVRELLKDLGAKMADQGSVLWAFEKKPTGEWVARFPAKIAESEKQAVQAIIKKLEEHPDVQKVCSSLEK